MRHIPKEVLAKNFQTAISAFDQIPNDQLYIFPAGTHPPVSHSLSRYLTTTSAPPPKNSVAPEDPYGTLPDP